ncbi:heavy-metal-associated domain-containing protein [Mycobacterium pseudoshottsii]|uniref:heavy-metal-associated domain-containing protein n=1 Tax=Mycobacterium pseudoshottsii TaxID=265949 RepID=UPI000A32AAC0|nr:MULTISPECIES: heavy metal-associated domain-containing protein [Mycobacterium ulcerans group]MBC9862518.1 Copper chaperone [Mycobacterium pseudoshottsii]RFZ64804.1 Heavy-metal-associated domain protein [Mycobacterium marinum]BBA90575.1 hypothetical protein MPSD_53320 [Mycobacterium pseudoshottsii JCM 15466]
MTEQTFAVTGLRCEGCVETITNALSALPSVLTVEVELDAAGASAVRVCTDTELTREQVQATLADNGDFAVVG